MMNLKQLEKRFSTEDACTEYLVALRWPQGPRCPRCKSEKVHRLSRPWKWQCKQCNKNGYRFSPLAGTLFENTNIPLRTWFRVVFAITQAKNGMSAHQVYRMIGHQQEGKGDKSGPGSYRTAWYMCHRIRAAMKEEGFVQLLDKVKVDETYVGGKNKNHHKSKRISGSGTAGKISVVGAIQREGKIFTKAVERTDRETLSGFVKEVVSQQVSLISTDEHSGYDPLKVHDYLHESVVHSEGEYVRGNVHMQNIDSFWALFKRGLAGLFHHVSEDYLQLCLNKFAFRHNNCKEKDIFAQVIAAG